MGQIQEERGQVGAIRVTGRTGSRQQRVGCEPFRGGRQFKGKRMERPCSVLFAVIATTALVTVTGCGVIPAGTTPRLATMENELSSTKAELAAVRAELEGLRSDFVVAQFNSQVKAMALLRPGDSGYSALSYDLGVVTVQLADIRPYANGSKVSLKVGNPLYSSVQGLSAKIDWGSTDAEGSPISESARTKRVEVNEVLRPGAWTTTHLILEGVPPQDLGFVRVSQVTHGGIQLAR